MGSHNQADQDPEAFAERLTQRPPEPTTARSCIPVNTPAHDHDAAKCGNQCRDEDQGRNSGQPVNYQRGRSEQGKHKGTNEQSKVAAALGARHVDIICASDGVLWPVHSSAAIRASGHAEIVRAASFTGE